MTAPAAPPTPATPPADLPDRSDPATFRTRIFALWTWMTGAMVTDLVALVANAYNNALSASESAGAAVPAAAAATAAAASAINAPGTSATSTTSLAIGTGSKTLTIQTGKSFYPGQAITIADSAAPGTNWMWGQITAHDSGTGSLTVNVRTVGGSGTKTAWTVALSADPGLGNKQDILVSGANIKTINNSSILGAGDLTVGGGSLIYITSVTASGASQVDIEWTNGTYDSYVIVASGVIASTSGALYSRLKIGGSYQTGGSYEYHVNESNASSSAYSGAGATSITQLKIGSEGGTPGREAAFQFFIDKPGASLYPMVRWFGNFYSGIVVSNACGVGRGASGILTGVRFYHQIGTITGTFRLYGIKNS